LYWALLQLLIAMWLWVTALKRFGRPKQIIEDNRIGKADYLLAMARVFRQGGHREHAAKLIFDSFLRSLIQLTKLQSKTKNSIKEIELGLMSRGRNDLKFALRKAERELKHASVSDSALLSYARNISRYRKISERSKP
jgi:hypothetical protein